MIQNAAALMQTAVLIVFKTKLISLQLSHGPTYTIPLPVFPDTLLPSQSHPPLNPPQTVTAGGKQHSAMVATAHGLGMLIGLMMTMTVTLLS